MCVLYCKRDNGGEFLKIFFSKDISRLEFDLGKTLCIFHHQYRRCLPKIHDGLFMEFAELKSQYRSYDFEKHDAIVFVGANKFLTPSSRIDPIFEFIPYSLPQDVQIISVDRVPYVGDLWRIWMHFYLTKTESRFGGYTYSYLLETHYNQYLEGIREDNPLDIRKIVEYSKGIVNIGYDRYFSQPTIRVIKVSPDVHEKYARIKAELFEKYDHISKIIQGLAKFAQSVCPSRKIPQIHRCFDSPDNIDIIRTDLKIDEFLVNKILEKIDEVNMVTKALYSMQL